MERLCNPSCSNLPAFLAPEGGLNSGFMMAHVTASALVSENKVINLTLTFSYIQGYKIFQSSRTLVSSKVRDEHLLFLLAVGKFSKKFSRSKKFSL